MLLLFCSLLGSSIVPLLTYLMYPSTSCLGFLKQPPTIIITKQWSKNQEITITQKQNSIQHVTKQTNHIGKLQTVGHICACTYMG